MFVAAYDDRIILPNYFQYFIWNTTKFCDLNLITPAINSQIRPKPDSKFRLNLLDPFTLPGYLHTRQLFNDEFINYSTLSKSFERACFHRWFALNAATIELSDNDFICLLDTDFLVGMNPSDVLLECISKSENSDIEFIAEWVGDDAHGPEITIMTKSYLFGFCKYLLTSYYSPTLKSQLLGEYFDRIGNGLPGGICDMRALATYSKLYCSNTFNLRTLDKYAIIYNFNSFLGDLGKTDDWKISFQSDKQILYFENEKSILIGTHFQGRAKTYMRFTCGENSEITRDICMNHLTSKHYFLEKIMTLLKRGINTIFSEILNSRFYIIYIIFYRKVFGFFRQDPNKALIRF